MDSQRPERNPAIALIACAALLAFLLVAYVAGYLFCSHKTNSGHRAFAYQWQAILFFPAVMVEYGIMGEPGEP